MGMLRYIERDKRHVIDFPEFKNLRDHRFDHRQDKDNIEIKKSFYDATIAFLGWYLQYANSITKEKTHKDSNICQQVFVTKIRNQKHFKECIIMHIYISRDYVLYLNGKITEENIHKYEHEISTLLIDLEEIISLYEVNCKRSVDKIYITSRRRKNLEPIEIFQSANQVFFIEELNDFSDLELRDMKPLVMFQIRQIIEIYGKNIIGYADIINSDSGSEIKKFTQIAWKFIRDETRKKEDCRIELPFNIDIILSINTWSNSFVHSTYIYASYIQFYALNAIKLLFTSNTKWIEIYNGNSSKHTTLADIKLYKYNLLKIDFENYVIDLDPKSKVIWMNLNRVGAYIISE